MNILLDTHAFLWWAEEPAKLSSTAFATCSDKANRLLISLVSVWEIQLKIQIGKLSLKLDLRSLLEEQQRENGIQLLPITLPHILGLAGLPDYHRDPFDRLLIAQAQVEGLALLSSDANIVRYPVPVIW